VDNGRQLASRVEAAWSCGCPTKAQTRLARCDSTNARLVTKDGGYERRHMTKDVRYERGEESRVEGVTNCEEKSRNVPASTC
jgi:hypothetical protein